MTALLHDHTGAPVLWLNEHDARLGITGAFLADHYGDEG